MVRKTITIVLFALICCICEFSSESNFILVKGGSFEMGRKGGKDNPIHKVIVSDFLIEEVPVTFGSWKEYLTSTGQFAKYRWGYLLEQFVGKKSPLNPDEAAACFDSSTAMYGANWVEAVNYCNWRSVRDGFVPAYQMKSEGGRTTVFWKKDASGYRLPTEAEWEYAALGGAEGIKSGWFRNARLTDYAWVEKNTLMVSKGLMVSIDGIYGSRKVGLKLPNPAGLYDILGNVSVWCWDYYDYKYYNSSPTRNPTGPSIGRQNSTEEPAYDPARIRVARGVSWSSRYPDNVLDIITWRGGAIPDYTSAPIGIRLVRNP